MKQLGARVVSVESGSKTLRDAVNGNEHRSGNRLPDLAGPGGVTGAILLRELKLRQRTIARVGQGCNREIVAERTEGSWKQREVRHLDVLGMLVIAGLPAVLILLQPDLGTALAIGFGGLQIGFGIAHRLTDAGNGRILRVTPAANR